MNNYPRAKDLSRAMLRWIFQHGGRRFDLAVRYPNGPFICKHSKNLDHNAVKRILPWTRFANANGAEIYFRPARGYSWPLVFLDDINPALAVKITQKYAAIAVNTSRQGGCHIWLHLDRPLDEQQRTIAQRFLQARTGADPASTSGEHWGRLAGTKNHKRNGQWIGIIAATHRQPWNPQHALSLPHGGRVASLLQHHPPESSRQRDESVNEFAWTCHALRNNIKPHIITRNLTIRAQNRGKRNPADYAKRTLKAAQERLFTQQQPL